MGRRTIGSDTSSPFQATWTNVQAGTYSLTAVATDNGNATTTSAAVTITVTAGGGLTLPGGWTNSDVGATGAAGSASYSNGTFTVTGAGADVWGTADALQYAYRTLSGDGAWVKAGVMIRNSLSAGAAQGFQLVAASATKGVPFQRRTADGGASVSTPGSQNTAPRWVKLVRAGNLISGYESPDGSNWTLVGSDNFTMGTERARRPRCVEPRRRNVGHRHVRQRQRHRLCAAGQHAAHGRR